MLHAIDRASHQADRKGWLRARRAVATTMVASAALSACSVEGSTSGNRIDMPVTTPFHSAVTAAPSPAHKAEKSLDNPSSACNNRDLPTRQARRRVLARECLDLYSHTTIALVNYDLKPIQAQALADRAEQLIETMTDYKINVDIVVTKPTKKARQEFKEVNAAGCIDADNISHFGSYIADKYDHTLNNDRVIAVSKDKACDDPATNVNESDTLGVADTGASNRFVQVFDDQHQRMPSKSDHGTDLKPNEAAATLAHESLHQVSFAHAGTNSQSWLLPDKKQLNLFTYLAKGQYDEYGEADNIMGYGEGLDVGINDLQRYILDWPTRELHPKAKSTMTNIRKASYNYGIEKLPDNFAMMKLEVPISLVRDKEQAAVDDNVVMFDQLAITPYITKDKDGNQYYSGYSLYLFDNHSTVLIGTEAIGKSQKTRQYNVGRDNFTVAIDNNGFSVSKVLTK